MAYGVARAVSGLAIAIFFYFKPCFHSKWDDSLRCVIALIECKYGLWNIVKGTAESFMLGGCIDHFSGREFYVLTSKDRELE